MENIVEHFGSTYWIQKYIFHISQEKFNILFPNYYFLYKTGLLIISFTRQSLGKVPYFICYFTFCMRLLSWVMFTRWSIMNCHDGVGEQYMNEYDHVVDSLGDIWNLVIPEPKANQYLKGITFFICCFHSSLRLRVK